MSGSVVIRNEDHCLHSTKPRARSKDARSKIYCRTSPSKHNTTLVTKPGNLKRLEVYNRTPSDKHDSDAIETMSALHNAGSCSNTACDRLALERHRRKHWSKIYDRSFHSMQWVNSSALVDMVSGVPLSHITLLCKNMICVKCFCPNCVRKSGLSSMFDYRVFAKTVQYLNENVMKPTGSDPEGCQLPPYWAKNLSTGTYELKESDVDLMTPAMNCLFSGSVGFNRKEGTCAIIETKHTSPGYLRLLDFEGKYLLSKYNTTQFFDIFPLELLQSNLSQIPNLVATSSVHQNGPAISITSDGPLFFQHYKHDYVTHYPCPSWPPEAEPWINRHRPSNWPTRETVRRIVSMGCSVVAKPHPLNNRTANIEFRFSFSNAEKILFQEMSLDQKHCFIAFKALMKRATEEIEGYENGMEMVLSTYHLKTIFLWTCETIDTAEWGTTCGWANCLLFLFDQLIIWLEHKSIPSFFIPQCNLLEGMEGIKLTGLLKIIKQVRSKPIKYAAEFVNSMKCFDSSRYSQHFTATNLDILAKSCLQSVYEISNTNSDKGQNFPPNVRNLNYHQLEIEDRTRYYEKERTFLQTFFQRIDSARSRATTENESVNMFRKKPCSYLASFANWCKENKDRKVPLFKELTLFDVMILNEVHGLSIPYSAMVDLVERNPSAHVCSGGTFSFKRSRGLVSQLKILLILYSMNAGEFERAKDEIYRLLMDDNFESEKRIHFDIEQMAVKTGYVWLFSHRTMSCIQEFNYVFDNVEASVSREVFFQFLLSMCHNKLKEKQELDFQLREMLEIYLSNSRSMQYFEMLLLGEVAEMTGNNILASEIYISSIMLNIRAIHELFRVKPKRTVRHWNVSCRDIVKFGLGKLYKESSERTSGPVLLYTMRAMLHLIKDHHLFSNSFYTISDAVYIAQHIIQMNYVLVAQQAIQMNHVYVQEAIPVLEKVVSAEYHHPLSVTIWPIELTGLVDENVKSEILKSRDKCIVVLSVVYALYLLANVYRSIGDNVAFVGAKLRLEGVCDHLGEGDTSISHTLLKYVQNV